MTLPHLVLGGFMGAGKTTVGRIVAARAGVPFVDLDEAILVLAAAAGHPFPSTAALFTTLGQATFRRHEAEALARALDAAPPTVIATGGGALVDPSSRARALAEARVVTLDAPPEVLLSRIAAPGQPRRSLIQDAPDPTEAARALLATRAAAYSEAHATVATDVPTPEEAAMAVERAWGPEALVVRLAERSYPVRFTGAEDAGAIVADVLAALRPTRWMLVTDTTVDALWGPAFLAAASRVPPPAAVVRLEPGERHKTLSAIEPILSAAIASGLDRSSVIVAHGGGVVSDMAGFAAAILLRGVRWVSVPTTLLAMSDAAIGGKTGVDVGAAKNAAGAFHQPSAVVIDPRRVATETDRAFTSGLAEIVKSAAIADAPLVDFLEREIAALRARSLPELERALSSSARVKASIVAADERETGVAGAARILLNFGHTLGHALEAAGGFERWTHGEAVSLGMVAALRAGVALGVTPPEDADRLVALLAALGLPVHLPRTDVEAALPYLTLDKKRSAGAVRAIFLTALGAAAPRALPLADLESLFRMLPHDDLTGATPGHT